MCNDEVKNKNLPNQTNNTIKNESVFGCIVLCGNVFFFNNFVTVDQIPPIEANKRTIYSRYNFDGPRTHRRIVGLLFVDCGRRSRNFWSLRG